ncbi:unnamed protein product [Amoebophrya sp. A120]|nr:unnamed protein product [Amoebophrya sp. A120]|eukprot:GSA120T00012794001.1
MVGFGVCKDGPIFKGCKQATSKMIKDQRMFCAFLWDKNFMHQVHFSRTLEMTTKTQHEHCNDLVALRTTPSCSPASLIHLLGDVATTSSTTRSLPAPADIKERRNKGRRRKRRPWSWRSVLLIPKTVSGLLQRNTKSATSTAASSAPGAAAPHQYNDHSKTPTSANERGDGFVTKALRTSEAHILQALFDERSGRNQTHTFTVNENLFGGPNLDCWADPRFNFRKCCNAMHYSVQMNHCWDGNKYTQENCCGAELYFPPTCLDLMRHFEFSMVQRLGQDDPITNAVTGCLKVLRSPDPELSLRGYVEPGFEPFDVAGWHYPTATVHHPGLRKFSFPALDAYVGNTFLVDGTWMPVEVELLRAFLPEDSVVVDAGANIGGFTLPFAKRVGRNGMVFAFEPFRVLFQHLTANVALNGLLNVQTFQHGLGKEYERVKLPMPNLNKLSNPAKSSVAATDNLMMIETEKEYEEEIEIKPLDDYFRRFPNRVYLIKIDVEKMEVPLLEGARAILQYHRPLLFVEDSEETRAGPPLNVTERPHLLDLINNKLSARFRPETEVSSAVTRLLWYYGYLCIDLYKEVGGQLTSLFCAPDEKLDGLWLGIVKFFDTTRYRGGKR